MEESKEVKDEVSESKEVKNEVVEKEVAKAEVVVEKKMVVDEISYYRKYKSRSDRLLKKYMRAAKTEGHLKALEMMKVEAKRRGLQC